MPIEKKFLAYGHELDIDVSPLSAGLAFAVDWDKAFIAKPALVKKKAESVESRIVSIVLDDINAVPLGNEPVMPNNKIIGKTTSSAFGFRVNAPVALADVSDANGRVEDAVVHVNIAGDLFAGKVKRGPVFDPKGSRMRNA